MNEDIEGLHILQVDYKNAFNLADREAAFREIVEHFPELAHLVANCYGIAASLVFGDKVILSTRGFHQRDPLAMLLFALILIPPTIGHKDQGGGPIPGY